MAFRRNKKRHEEEERQQEEDGACDAISPWDVVFLRLFSRLVEEQQQQQSSVEPQKEEAEQRQWGFIRSHWLSYGLPVKSFHFTGNVRNADGSKVEVLLASGKQLLETPEDVILKLRDGYEYELVQTRQPRGKIYLGYRHLRLAIEQALPDEYLSLFFSLPEEHITTPRAWYEALEDVLLSEIDHSVNAKKNCS